MKRTRSPLRPCPSAHFPFWLSLRAPQLKVSLSLHNRLASALGYWQLILMIVLSKLALFSLSISIASRTVSSGSDYSHPSPFLLVN